MGLSCGVVCVILRLAVLIHLPECDGHTDTRRRHIPRLARRRPVKTETGVHGNVLIYSSHHDQAMGNEDKGVNGVCKLVSKL